MNSPFSLRLGVMLGLVTWLEQVRSESFYSGPQKQHQALFHKQSDNKTIPFSEKPGEEMIVFDVDGTLWPYQIDTDPRFQDPFTIKSFDNGTVLVGNHTIELFPEVEATLQELIDKGYVLAAVSLTNSTYKTMAVLNAFDLNKQFKFMDIAPGPDKISLVTEICSRSGILRENVLFFEKDPEEVLDMLWNHVIVYCVNEKGLTKECARKGLFVYDIRPRKGRSQHGPQSKKGRKNLGNKNKSRPAQEKDGTEIEGFDYNATKIEYD